MAVDREQDEAALVRASLELVLGCLPERLVPSRGFITACSEFAVALAEAWLALYVIGAQPGNSSQEGRGASFSLKPLHDSDDALRSRLDVLVGPSCSRAWWADAAERLEHAKPVVENRQLQPEVPIGGAFPTGGGGSSGSSTRATTPTPTPSVTGSTNLLLGAAPQCGLPEGPRLQLTASDSQGALQTLLMKMMRQSLTGMRPCHGGGLERSACYPVREDSDSFRSNILQEQWLCFGVAWVLCALDDVIGSVVAHCRRKAAQPRTGATARPSSSSGRPGSGRLATSGGRSRPGTGEQRPRTPAAEGSGSQQPVALERRRLLALKHFVAAVKVDRDLQACSLLETCLVEVATGVAPHVEASQLLASQVYHQRLRLWAEQEVGDEPGAVDDAFKQAMKDVGTANVTTPRPSREADSNGRTKGVAPRRSPHSRAVPAVEKTAPAMARKSQGWLPQAFVQTFNAEGEEVEEELVHSDAESDGSMPKQHGVGSLSVKSRVVFAERLEA